MIVDANTAFRQYLEGTLQTRYPALALVTARGAQEALAHVDGARPALVFIDVHLPDGRGFELVRRVRRLASDTKIVVLSSCDFPEYRDEALRRGADHYLAKWAIGIDDVFVLVDSIAASRSMT